MDFLFLFLGNKRSISISIVATRIYTIIPQRRIYFRQWGWVNEEEADKKTHIHIETPSGGGFPVFFRVLHFF